MARLGGTSQWRLWRYVAIDDAVVGTGDTAPSSLAAPRDEQAGVITVRGWSHITARGFGVGGNNDVFTLTILGWMDNGPGELLYRGTATTGLESYTEDLLDPIPGPGDQIPTGLNWSECQLYAEEATMNTNWSPGDTNEVTSGATTAHTTSETNHLVIPTGAHKYLQIFITGVTDGNPTNAAVIWRPLKGYK